MDILFFLIILSDVFQSIWQMFAEHGQTISDLVLIFTLFVIIWYTIETRHLRKATEKSLFEMQKQLEPNVITYFDNGSNFYSILLILSNEGQSSAYNVKLNSDKEIDFGGPIYKEYLYKNAIFNKGISIPPAKKYIIRVSSTKISSNLMKEEKIPTSYKLTLSYDNGKGKSFESTFELSIDQFFNRLDPESQPTIEKQLKEINSNLQSITEAINNKAI